MLHAQFACNLIPKLSPQLSKYQSGFFAYKNINIMLYKHKWPQPLYVFSSCWRWMHKPFESGFSVIQSCESYSNSPSGQNRGKKQFLTIWHTVFSVRINNFAYRAVGTAIYLF